MNTLRKRPTYDNLVYYLNHQPNIQYPARKGIRAVNDTIISNMLFDDDLTDEMMNDKKRNYKGKSKSNDAGRAVH